MKSLNEGKRSAAYNDFRRSLSGSLLFPAITLFILLTCFTYPLILDGLRLNEQYYEAIMINFVPDGSSMIVPLVQMGMVLCGMLTAVKSLSFLMNKAKVNLFLGLGIKRKTMLMNRFAAGAIALFVPAFLPMLAIYIFNIIQFGFSPYFTEVFLYTVALFFVSGIAGFSIAAVMTVLSGNVAEAFISSYALSKIVITVANLIDKLSVEYMQGVLPHRRGSVWFLPRNDVPWINILSPWSLAFDLNKYHTSWVIDSLKSSYFKEFLKTGKSFYNFQPPEQLQIDIGRLSPIIVWFAVSLVLIGIAVALFNKRQVENANSLGKFKSSRLVISLYTFVASAYGITYLLTEEIILSKQNSLVLVVILSLIAAFILYIIVNAVMLRNKKAITKSLLAYTVFAAVLVFISVAVNTELFGMYNRVSDKADVKSVSVEINTGTANYFENNIEYRSNSYVDYLPVERPFTESETDNSKEAVFEICKLLSKEKVIPNEDYIVNVTVAIRDNDGDVKYRNFRIYSEETFVKYLELVYNSDFFDLVLKNKLIDTDYTISEEWITDDKAYRYRWFVRDNSFTSKYGEYDFAVRDGNGLCEALYKDLSSMSFEQILRNSEKPVCVIIDNPFNNTRNPLYEDTLYTPVESTGLTSADDFDAYPNATDRCIPVYAEMTNTVKFLEEAGYGFKNKSAKIKEILYADELLSSYDALLLWAEANKEKVPLYSDSFMEMRVVNFDRIFNFYGVFPCTEKTFSNFLAEEITAYELLKDMHYAADTPLKSVTDENKINEIMDNVVTEYLLTGDNGRYIYVIYDDGEMLCQYIPEANVSVLN